MKNKFRSFVVASLTAVGFGLIASSLIGTRAKADAWDKMTIVTLNERMIAGNRVLEPGTYVWKLLDSPSERHVVQIFNSDQSHLYETILAIPNYRLEPTGDSRFAFYETPPGVPKAVRAWFYPGDNFGQEFKYPKKLVAELASAVPVPIPMNYKEEAQPAAEPAPAPTPAPEPVAPQPAPPVEPAPAPEPQPTPQADATVTPAPAALPHTGSNVPLIALLGIASLGLASVFSFKANRT